MSKTLIELASKKKWPEFGEALASVEGIGKTYQPELWLRAVSSRNVKILGALLSLGIDINARWKTYTALTTAAELVDLDLLKWLHSNGANIHQRGFDEGTPLICAARVATEWEDPAIRSELLRVTKWLVSKGDDVNAHDVIGLTALDLAYRAKWIELARFLFSKGAQIALCEEKGQQLLLHAVTMVQDLEFLKLYLKNGGDATLEIGDGVSALNYARKTGRKDMEKLLKG